MSSVKRSLAIGQSKFNLFHVYWAGGGEVPDMLKGEYTSLGAAQLALKAFYAHKQANVKAPAFKYKKQPPKKTKENKNG